MFHFLWILFLAFWGLIALAGLIAYLCSDAGKMMMVQVGCALGAGFLAVWAFGGTNEIVPLAGIVAFFAGWTGVALYARRKYGPGVITGPSWPGSRRREE